MNKFLQSRKFIYKNFKDIRIGDIISSYHNFNLYRVYQHITEETIYFNKHGKMQCMFDKISAEKIENELEIFDQKIGNILLNKKITGIMTKYKRINTETYANDQLFFYSRSFLVLDEYKNTKNYFWHKSTIKKGDIILRKHDNKFYKMFEFVQSSLEDNDIDCSYYIGKELDNNLNVVENGSLEQFGIGIDSSKMITLDREII